jgi:cell division protease FtsH
MFLPGVDQASSMTAQMVDEETRRIVERAEEDVVELLKRERERLEALAQALLERETLDFEDAYRVAGLEAPRAGDQEKATEVAPGPTASAT